MKVLVVDDSRAMRMIVMRTLRQAGFDDFKFTEAENGLKALQAVRADCPDLVLSDWNMPEMTGVELVAKLKEEAPDLKVGLITTESTPEMRQQAQAAGALFLVTKPVTAESLRIALDSVLA